MKIAARPELPVPRERRERVIDAGDGLIGTAGTAGTAGTDMGAAPSTSTDIDAGAGTRARRSDIADVADAGADRSFGRFLQESLLKRDGGKTAPAAPADDAGVSAAQALAAAQAMALLELLPARATLTSSLLQPTEWKTELVVDRPSTAREEPALAGNDDKRDAPVLLTGELPPLGREHVEAPGAVAMTAPAGPVEASEGVTQALAALDDPALFASLDRNRAVVIVDGLHIRLSTSDGATAISVEGRDSAAMMQRSPELREALGAAGLTLQRLTPAGANTDAHLDRQGRAVVDIDEDAAPRAANDVAFDLSINA